MYTEDFVMKIKTYVREAAIDDTISALNNPPGRNPRSKYVLQSEWYNKLTTEDKTMLGQVLAEAVDEAIFGMFAVLDGVELLKKLT